MSDKKKQSLLESIRNIAGTKQIHESRMAEVDQIMQDVASGELDINQLLQNPQSPEEKYAAQQLQQMIDVKTAESGLAPDDDLEEIIQRVIDDMQAEYGSDEPASAMEPLSAPRMSAEVAEARRRAGLPLVEGWDDDDEDADVRAADRELKKVDKKNPKAAAAGKQAEAAAKKVNADKDMSKLAKKSKADDDEDDTPAKKEAPKAEEKKEEAAPVSAEKFASLARAFLAHNPNASATEVRAHCVKKGCTPPAHFHSRLSGIKASIKKTLIKKSANEGFILIHPQMPSFVLAENLQMNQYQWVSMKDEKSSLEPMVFVSEAEAKKVMTYVKEYKNQACILTTVKLDD